MAKMIIKAKIENLQSSSKLLRWSIKMARGKEHCPNCGSKKITIESGTKKCRVCHFEWTGKIKKHWTKKDKVRF
jgi:transposase-like protein